MTKCVENFVEVLIDNFSYNDFDPDMASNIPKRFKEIFFQDTAYWEQYLDNKDFIIEFKKYGKNRKKAGLKFSFNESRITLTLLNLDDEHTIDSQELLFADIWIDHTLLNNILSELISTGLKRSQEPRDGF